MNSYRIGIRGKKLWAAIFIWLFDHYVVNLGICIEKNHPTMSQLQYRHEIVIVCLTRYGKLPKIGSRPSPQFQVCSATESVMIFVIMAYVILWFRCLKEKMVCWWSAFSIRTMCIKYSVRLCIECFKLFHTHTHWLCFNWVSVIICSCSFFRFINFFLTT